MTTTSRAPEVMVTAVVQGEGAESFSDQSDISISGETAQWQT